MIGKKLYYIPAEDRTVTRADLEIELEYIGCIYPAYIDSEIEEMENAGAVILIFDNGPRATLQAEKNDTIERANAKALENIILNRKGK